MICEDFIILKIELAGEKSQKFSVLPKNGDIFLFFKKQVPSKLINSNIDLFDEISCELTKSKNSNNYFVKDFNLIKRNSNIAKNYNNFLSASLFSSFLLKNITLLPETNYVFELSSKVFCALSNNFNADIIFLKALYSFVQNQGFGAKELWLINQNNKTLNLIKSPLKENPPKEDIFCAKNSLESLKIFVKNNTPILL